MALGAFLCAAFLTAPAHAQDITTGLVGHWKLDELTGTTATDSSVGGNDGTMNGGLDAANDTSGGKIGTSLSFDGTDDSITMGDLDIFDSAPVTGCAWVKHDTITADQSILTNLVNVTNGNGIQFARDDVAGISGRTDTYSVSLSDSDDTDKAILEGATDASTTDTWTHVCFTAELGSATGLRLYINGVEDANSPVSTIGIGGIDSGTGTFEIGEVLGVRPFDGNIDDVRIYDRALTPEDIAVLASGTAPGGIRYNDETEGVEYHDGFDWVHTGLGSYSANAVEFDGTNDYLEINSALNNVSDNKKLSGSFWVKQNNLGAFTRLGEIGDDSAGLFVFSTGISDQFRMIGENSSGTVILDMDTPDSTIDGTWQHVLFSFDLSDSSKRHIYVNDVDSFDAASTYTDDILDLTGGDQAVGGTHTGGSKLNGELADFWIDVGTYIDFSVAANRRKFISANGAPMYLGPDGSLPLGRVPDIFLTGDTDDWHTNKGTGGGFTENGALTDATTQPGDNDITSGLVGHWKLDETSGATITDYGSGGNDGTWNDNADNDVTGETVTGEIDNALDFDGTDDYIDAGNPAVLDDMTVLSVGAWIKPDVIAGGNCGGFRMIAQKNESCNAPNDGWFFNVTPWGTLMFAENRSFADLRRLSADTVTVGEWQHVMATWNGGTTATTDVKIYLNGREVTYVALWDQDGSGTDQATNDPFRIGAVATSAVFDGQIDDVRIYDRALSAEEVKAVYLKTALCSSPAKAGHSIIYNTDDKVMQYCNGTDWVAMGPVGGTGGGGCAGPVGAAGDFIYNEDWRVLQYCNAEDWVGIGQPGPIPTTGLVGHWKLDETTGTTADDATANNNDGTMNGGLDADNDAVTGKLAAGLAFDDNNEMIEIADDAVFDFGTGNFAVALWFKTSGYLAQGSSANTLLSKSDGSTNSGDLDMDWRLNINSSNEVTFIIEDANSGPFYTSPNATGLNDNQWHHVVGQRSGGDMEIYIDGVSLGASGRNSVDVDTNNTVNIGCDGGNGNAFCNSRNFIGDIDDVRIYDRALSPGEISHLYHATR